LKFADSAEDGNSAIIIPVAVDLTQRLPSFECAGLDEPSDIETGEGGSPCSGSFTLLLARSPLR
jgi:hypothetical protein